MTRLSPHFALGEFLPRSMREQDVPEAVLLHLAKLAESILEPVRERFGLTVWVNSGFRPPALNALTPGSSRTSDHTVGRAADFYVVAGNGESWQANTLAAFEFIRTDLAGVFGQLILEDHRDATGIPGKLWVHVAIPSPRHPGDGTDADAVLYSYYPQQYQRKPREAVS